MEGGKDDSSVSDGASTMTLIATWGDQHALVNVPIDAKVSVLARESIRALRSAGDVDVAEGPDDLEHLPRRRLAGVTIAKRVTISMAEEPQLAHVPDYMLVKNAFTDFEQVLVRRHAVKPAKTSAGKVKAKAIKKAQGKTGTRQCSLCHSTSHNARTCTLNPKSSSYVGDDNVAAERLRLTSVTVKAAPASAPGPVDDTSESEDENDSDDDTDQEATQPVSSQATATASDDDTDNDDSDDSDTDAAAKAAAAKAAQPKVQGYTNIYKKPASTPSTKKSHSKQRSSKSSKKHSKRKRSGSNSGGKPSSSKKPRHKKSHKKHH